MRSLLNILGDIQDKFDKVSESKAQQLQDAYAPCRQVLQELDESLLRYHGLDTRSRREWDRANENPEKSGCLRDRLALSVSNLNDFYSSLAHDSQVLILEALDRLEIDYTGGYRKESIPSVQRIISSNLHDENQDDHAAWGQILRDLEDAGVSQKEASNYRDVIVDWFVTAVNDGMLSEENQAQSHAASSFAAPWSQRNSRNPFRRPLTPSASATSRDASAEKNGRGLQPLPSGAQNEASNGSITPAESQSSNTASSLPPDPMASAPPGASIASEEFTAPPSYDEIATSVSADIEQTAKEIIAAWDRRDFLATEKLLEQQLAAVEHGRTVSLATQPDRRILIHLMGVCASFRGDFQKAKKCFEKVLHGLSASDDGDIAAAIWLGDACLHLQEHLNAILAYSIAFEGCNNRYGITHNRTRRVTSEMQAFDQALFVFKRVERSFALNVDPTNIFASVPALEKSNLLTGVKYGLYRISIYGAAPAVAPVNNLNHPSFRIGIRARYDPKISKAFLVAPLITTNAWPLPWDSTFSPIDAVQFDRRMNTVRGDAKLGEARFDPLVERQVPNTAMGDSKNLLFITKRSPRWLIETVKSGLQDMGIQHEEHNYESSILCRISQQYAGFSFLEGIEIQFKKLQFRNSYGIKIGGVKWVTRRFGLAIMDAPHLQQDVSSFKDLIREMLEGAEARALPEF